MRDHRPPIRPAAAACLSALALLALAACGDDDPAATRIAPDASPSGDIVIDGSSTVAPLTRAAADGFTRRNPGATVEVAISGTGGGFARFCAGETDASNASRRITADEAAACRENGVTWRELRVASDGITVVVSREADVGTACLTIPELREAWRAGSEVDDWRDLDPRFADLPLRLAGAGEDSGTYDLFNEKVLGTGPDGDTLRPRDDYLASEDDDVTVRAVEETPGTMGYFGYSYFARERERLTAIAVDAGGPRGCVAPSPLTITEGAYPLSRPLFVYVSRAALARPVVREFFAYYLRDAVALARSVEIVQAPTTALDRSLAEVLR